MRNYLDSEFKLKEFDKFITDLNPELLSFDTETSGLQLHRKLIVGFSISWTAKNGMYVPFLEWVPDKSTEKAKTFKGEKYQVYKEGWFRCVWTGKTYPENITPAEYDYPQFVKNYLIKWVKGRKLIMHNGPFDVCMVKTCMDIDLTPELHADTALLAHIINENSLNGLKAVAEEWSEELKFDSKKAATQEAKELGVSVLENGGGVTNTLRAKSVWRASPEVLARYAIKDTDLTFGVLGEAMRRLKEDFTDKTLKWIFEEEVMPFCREVSIPLKLAGIDVDLDHFRRQDAEVSQYMAELEGEFIKHVQPHLKDFKPTKTMFSVVKDRNIVEKIIELENLPKPTKEDKDGNVKVSYAKAVIQKMYNQDPHWLWGYILGEDEIPYPDEKLDKIKSEIFHEKTGKRYEFNLGSDDHLRYLFLDALGMGTEGLPETDSSTKKKPKYSMKAEVLKEHMLPEYSWVKLLLRYKKLKKLHSTYILPAINLEVGGKLYMDYKQNGTSTGRASTGGGYNLQTLPNTEKEQEAIKYCSCGSDNVELSGDIDVIQERKCLDCGELETVVISGVIKQGFIAPDNYKLIGSDFSALEPRCFSFQSGDEGLMGIWDKGLDMYSYVILEIHKDLKDKYSADPKATNYLKKVDPLLRSEAKVFTLAVPYGASKYQVANLMGKYKDVKTPDGIITIPDGDFGEGIRNQYLDAFPELQVYMDDSVRKCVKEGWLETYFGRRRHFPEAVIIEKILNRAGGIARDLISISNYKLKGTDVTVEAESGRSLRLSDYLLREVAREAKLGYHKVVENDGWSYIKNLMKSYLNSARNFRIQGLAGHLLNMSMIEIMREFKKRDLDAKVILGVHDEVIGIAHDDCVEEAAEIIRDKMENNSYTNQIPVPMIAEPIIGQNLAECK